RRLGEQPEGGRAPTVTFLPLPPEPLPRQVAFGLVGTFVVPVLSVCSVSVLPPLPTTRRSALTPFPAAMAAVENSIAMASAHAAASRIGARVGIQATLSSRVVMAGRGQVSWLPGPGPPHLPGGSVSPPVAGAMRQRLSFARSQWRDRAGLAPDFP